MAKENVEEMVPEVIDQDLYGDKVEKVGGRAIIHVDDVIVSLVIPVTYPQIVSALVDKKYPADAMQAIQNNYLADPDDADHKAEFDAMQAWRVTAKAAAHEILGE